MSGNIECLVFCEHQLHTPFVVFSWKQHLHVTALQSALLVTLDEVSACHNTPNLWYIILFRSGIGRKWNICNSQSASVAPSTKISKKFRIPRIEEGFYKLRPANKADHLLQGSKTLHSVKQFIPIMFVYDYKSSHKNAIFDIFCPSCVQGMR